MIEVLVVDYKVVQAFNVAKNLRSHGFDATSVNDFMQLLLQLFNRHIDVVVLDLECSGLADVLSVKQIRSLKNLQALGIIIVTSNCELSHRLELIANGADACLSKPVDVVELSAYINSIYRRVNFRESTIFPSQWHFNRSEWCLVTPSGTSLALSHLEVSLMDMLVKSLGNPVKRRDIIAIGFGLNPLSYDNRRLNSIVSRLRRKMHNAYPLSQPIKVVHSVGYIFTEAIRIN
jgi:two-component system OmpR family response regulator